jgi:hypothetical protein
VNLPFVRAIHQGMDEMKQFLVVLLTIAGRKLVRTRLILHATAIHWLSSLLSDRRSWHGKHASSDIAIEHLTIRTSLKMVYYTSLILFHDYDVFLKSPDTAPLKT